MSTPTPSSPARHVVFGAGAVGLHLAEALVRRGVPASDVRLVNRSGTAAAPAGVQTVGGDVLGDPDFAATAARGATVVYQVLNPAYHRWAEEFPVLQDRVLDAAARAGARLVTLENVYAYGRLAPGRTLTEDTPFDAHTRKGAVRARMHLDLVAAVFGLKFGETSALSSVVYSLVGLAGLYQALTWKSIQRRWHGDVAGARA